MNELSSGLIGIAAQLIDNEAQRNLAPEGTTANAFPVVDKLRLLLTKLMGKVGFTALLSRSLSIAGRQVSWLQSFHVTADGIIASRDHQAEALSPDDGNEGRIVLVATLLGLLETFVGEELMFRLLLEQWPQLSRSEFSVIKGDKNEKAN